MDQETCMVKQIRSLDSDMQTLVYENYNKFISATGEGMLNSVLQQGSVKCNCIFLSYTNYWFLFLLFPDTIRKMKNDFKKMEDEMDCLSANMAAITEFSACISGTLQDQHTQITKLSGETMSGVYFTKLVAEKQVFLQFFLFFPGVHTLLRKLQFLFELPARLNKCLELQAYAQAVSSYRRARCVLQQYSHLPSFRGIQDDCHAIMEELAQELRQKFRL